MLSQLRNETGPILLDKPLAHERDALEQKGGNFVVGAAHQERDEVLLQHCEAFGRNKVGCWVVLFQLLFLFQLAALRHRLVIVRECVLLQYRDTVG